MHNHWWVILVPLAFPSAVAAVGGGLGVIAVAKNRGRVAKRGPIVLAFVILAAVAAWIPNAGQQLYDLGVSFPVIDIIQTASYFAFAFALVCAWQLLHEFRRRWFLSILVPVSFAQPLLWTWAYFSWTIWGFAP
jgi:hypothetical protein